jgi:hypothetical protein
MDFMRTNGYSYSELDSNSKSFVLEWKNEIERQKYLINNYAAEWFRDWQLWVNESLDGWIDPSFVMCIWLAESWLWKSLSSAYNVWNVWNNDRGDRRNLSSPKEWIASIIYALNNKYLINYNDLAHLSWWWREENYFPACWATPTEYCYATDTKYWHNNMKRCLSHLKWVYILDSYNFRF